MSALTLEGVTFCFRACFCTVSCHIDGGSSTFAVLVIGTVVGFAINLDGFASAMVVSAVHSTLTFFAEASA